MSVIYSPHGVSYEVIRPWASSHLVTEAALPLTALIHSFDRVENPWYLGGNISAGSPGGIQIAQSLYARAWISAHDADKNNRGLSVKQTRVGKYAVEEIKRLLQQEEKIKLSTSRQVNVIALASGEEHRIESG
jgi:hypothetical protein